MKDNGKRREWVKTAAIVFLSVMLVLTFFSNTIMNYSLPEVATQYVMSGSITAKIRGTGTIESGDPYNVKISESRKVASVAVRVGDEVQKGDILMYLEDADSEELKAALEALETAKDELKAAQDAVADARDDYNKALIDKDVSTSDIQAANGGASASAYRSKVTEYQNQIAALERELEPLKNSVKELESAIGSIEIQEAYEKQVDSTIAGDLTAKQNAYYNATGASGENADAVAAKSVADSWSIYQTAVSELEAAKAALKAGQDAVANMGALQAEVDEANAAVQDAEAKRNQAEIELAQAQEASETEETIAQLEAARNEADDKCTKAQAAAENAQKALSDVQSINLEALQAAVNTAQADHDNKKATYERLANLQQAYNAAVQSKKDREGNPVHSNLNGQKATYQLNLDVAKKNVAAKEAEIEQKQTELDELLGKVNRIMGIEDYLDKIEDAQEVVTKAENKVAKAQAEVDKQTSNSVGATITAPIAGTITSLGIQAGETTHNDMTVAVMQPEGQGYSLSFSVTNDQAKTLSVGDQADLVNAWRYDDVTVTLKSIKTDKNDPGQKKLLTFDVTGNVIAGQSLSVSVGQKSANYDYIVPNSAIREDNNGKFILIITSKSGPLSTRYIASRVDVEVLASDDTQSAIRGALNNYDFVITTSTKPVEAGKQVRLSGN